MRIRFWAGLGGAAVVFATIAGACSDDQPTSQPGAEPGSAVPTVTTPLPTPTPATTGRVSPDGGASPDAGPAANPGPWPTEPTRDYSQAFGLGNPQSVSLDEALNLWLLDGDRIGFLRPTDLAPTWTRGVGQARAGFGWDAPAMGSTVICGGEAGRAYVGYHAYGLSSTIPGRPHAFIPSPGEAYYTPERYAEYQKGDLDAVRAEPAGTVVLEEHLWRTVGASNKDKQLGIHNTNDFHYDEDRDVLACQRVTRGPQRGDLYITTNHGVTRIQGLTYNSHRHPGWYKQVPLPDGTVDQQLQTPDMHGLGVAPNGNVLVANEQMVGVLVPSAKLEEWDREQTFEGPTPWLFKGFNAALNGVDADDYWRAFEQTTGGQYWLGSREYGVWRLELKSHTSGAWTKLGGLPSERISSMKATDDGALYIGTDGAGLWRLEADGQTLSAVTAVSGRAVRQLVYEPSVTPSMLLVLTESGLTVLRGP